VVNWGGGTSARCRPRVQLFVGPRLRAMGGCIVRCGIISSCQSAEIVKHFWTDVGLYEALGLKQVPDLYLLPLTLPDIIDYSFNKDYQNLIIFRVSLQYSETTGHQRLTFQVSTSPNVCFCTTWRNKIR